MLVPGEPEVISQQGHLPGPPQADLADLSGQLGLEQRFDQDAVLLPGGSRARMDSMSWEGLLLPSSPPKISLRHWSMGLGMKRSIAAGPSGPGRGSPGH